MNGWIGWIQYFKKSQTVGFAEYNTVTQMRRAARRLYDWRLHYIVLCYIYVYRIEFLSFFVDEPLIII